ncbi:hypothetical protein QR680_016035 [Steinernema hermaphroditum]|uniref:Methyltransferase FkbM domain-containing protein n=1 Tax=Steinernema hermaphroditum TaxID=289476 RepID=A0AA39LLW5_9BILA|nr:hypothetical protein QR680_016035 [Steinernema hermaphroditum]
MRWWKVVVGVAVVVTASWFFLPRNDRPLNQREHMFHSHDWCVETSIKGQPFLRVWDELDKVVSACEKWAHFNIAAFTALGDANGTKYHLLPSNVQDPLHESIVLSIGIGLHITHEQSLKKLCPTCKFVGIDPIRNDNQEVYSKIGVFYPFFLSDAVVQVPLSEDKENGTTQVYIGGTIVEFVTFIKRFIKSNTIDQIFLDANYQLLKYFLSDGALNAANIVVCQINFNANQPDIDELMTFINFVIKLLGERRYALFRVFNIDGGAGRTVVFINFDSSFCIDKYMLHKGSLVVP